MNLSTSQLPGTTALIVDYFENYENVAEFYNGDFRDIKAFQTQAEKVAARDLPLEQLTTILYEQNQKFGCNAPTLENINRLLQKQVVAVVTGQQVGLFSGPLYTIYKALTAIKLAAYLNQLGEGGYVPIFWLASDDHDFREANHIHIINKNNQLIKINYHAYREDARIPLFVRQLTSEIKSVITKLTDETYPSQFKDNIIHLLTDAYQSKCSFAQAFGKWLMHLLKSFGLILMDASDPRMKNLGKEIFRKEIAGQSPSSQQVMATSKKLVLKKYHAQVQLHPNLLNLFFIDKERQTLEAKNDSYGIKGSNQIFQRQELFDILNKEPQRFSPNVLLRPIYQDALLPTVAYVAGTAEIAYFAQMKEVYKAFGLSMPIIYPRSSITLIEAKINKLLDAYDLNLLDIWGDIEIIINNIAKTQLPAFIEEKIKTIRSCIDQELNLLEKGIASIEPTLRGAVEVTKGKLLHQMEILEKKILQAQKSRNEIMQQQVYKIRNHLYPNGKLQERELNVVQFLFKYGLEFLNRLYDEINIHSFHHQIIKL